MLYFLLNGGKMNKLKQQLEDKIKHEKKVYESNIQNYDEYEKGLYVGLIRGLRHVLNCIKSLEKAGN